MNACANCFKKEELGTLQYQDIIGNPYQLFLCNKCYDNSKSLSSAKYTTKLQEFTKLVLEIEALQLKQYVQLMVQKWKETS